MKQLFLIAIRNLIQHRKRSVLLGGAIAGVSVLLTLLIGLSAGVHSTLLESATTLSTGHINVAGFYKVTAGQAAPVITEYKRLTEIVKRTLPDVDFVSPRGRGWAKMVSETGSMQTAIGGIMLDQEPRFKKVIQVVDGDLNELSKTGNVLIFEEQAKKIGVKVGDTVVFSSETPRGVSNTLDARVVAIAKDMGFLSAWNVYMHDDSVRQLNQINSESTGALQVHLKDMKRIPEDMDLLRKALEKEGFQLMDREAKPFWEKFQSVAREDWTGQKLDLTSWEEEMSFIKWTTAAVDGLMYVLTTVLLIIIGIGVMNSMWIAIRERTREIGTLRAIGMHRRRVLAMFMIEAFSLGALGTAVGAILGIIFIAILNSAHLTVPPGARMFLMSSNLHFLADFVQIFKGMAIITGCMTIISMFPSIHAARLKPVTAMSHIG
jgi:ABC-type lipoprotein release transport system permease subunit